MLKFLILGSNTNIAINIAQHCHTYTHTNIPKVIYITKFLMLLLGALLQIPVFIQLLLLVSVLHFLLVLVLLLLQVHILQKQGN